VKKLTSAIKAINLNATTINNEEYAATFHNEVMEPSFINFGFGNNGTGKSSVAKAIRDDVGIDWTNGKSADDYTVLVYDRQFIDDHFANYNYLPGIYTMGEKNIEIQKQINTNTAEAKKHRDKAATTAEAKAIKERERNNLFPSFHETFWQIGASIREDFKKVLTGKVGSKAAFATALLQNTATPTQHDLIALKELYDVAFGGTPETPDTFDVLNLSHLKSLTEFPLLDISIVGRDDSEFNRFIKALNATDWIKRGLDRFVPHTKGKCPFCQQRLPVDFSEQIAACFDQHYQDDMNALNQHRNDYERYARTLLGVLSGNLRKNIYTKFSKEQRDLYVSKAKTVESKLKLNMQTLDSKLAEPSKKVEIESVESLCVEINNIIAEYNRLVQSSKAIHADLRNQKRACEKQVWEILAFETQALIAKYKADDKKLLDEITTFTNLITAETKAANALDVDNGKLNKQIVSIKTAVDGINRLLLDSGFQGFELRVYDGSGQSAYRVVRPHTGKVAKDLSEGERNFIGFLYFYYLVQGSHSDDDLVKEKIVVIDDPVSSMDATVLHIVGMLTREMIDACLYERKIKGVKQVFVLTHNVHFHTKVANPLVSKYEVASYFLLTKTDNNSTVTHCIQNNPNAAGEKENYNPVPSEYAALWKDYKSVNTPKVLRSLIWQILDFYFVKLSQGNGDSLKECVLITNRDKFIEQLPNGTEDSSKLVMAAKLLSYMGTSAHDSDESYYADHYEDIDGYRKSCEMIFTTMGQDQHYRMMMAEIEK